MDSILYLFTIAIMHEFGKTWVRIEFKCCVTMQWNTVNLITALHLPDASLIHNMLGTTWRS